MVGSLIAAHGVSHLTSVHTSETRPAYPQSRMPPTRRTFLQQAAALGLTCTTLKARALSPMQDMSKMAPPPRPILHSLELPPFVDALPIPQLTRPNAAGKLRVTMREVHTKVHRDVPATRLWTYDTPLIEARSGQSIDIEWVNNLPKKHFLPIDHSLHGCGRDIPDVRACVHVHGARTLSKDDGQPGDWYPSDHSRVAHYPLQQDSAGLWFHDHAMGLNRLNVYAGLVGQLLIRDAAEDALHLPSGPYEIPLTLYDRDFTDDGQLYYPDSGDPEHPWVSEFVADAILINGKIRPYLEVEPRVYRFRVLNAANSRFFSLSLTGHAPFLQIGSDQGLLPAPLIQTTTLLAPAERADILIDFSHLAGQRIHMVNAPWDILEFRVTKPLSKAPVTSIPATLRPVPRTPESAAIKTRTITLNEYKDKVGNSMLMLLNNKRWHEPVTEQPKLNTTEIWEFVNLTEDVHPMHLHLVRFQILDRRVFDTFAWDMKKEKVFRGPVILPEPHELGWKDTVQCPSGMITRIIARFDGYPGKYLYHCHILEHEANDMMRPFEVLA